MDEQIDGSWIHHGDGTGGACVTHLIGGLAPVVRESCHWWVLCPGRETGRQRSCDVPQAFKSVPPYNTMTASIKYIHSCQYLASSVAMGMPQGVAEL
jgi:hypothetical protein